MRIEYYSELDSTNRLARERALQQAPSGTIIHAARQSAGRGQYKRSFASPPGGLYFSLILRPDISAQDIAMITLAAGLGCRDALAKQCGLAVRLKWPNDLYCKDRKLAGILCEYCMMPDEQKEKAAVIVGAGLNVNSRVTDFPLEVQPILTTVREECGKEYKVDELLLACAAGIEERVAQLQLERSRLLADWQEADYLAGRRIRHWVQDELVAEGVGQGIDAQGRYRLQQDDGQIRSVLGGQLRPV